MASVLNELLVSLDFDGSGSRRDVQQSGQANSLSLSTRINDNALGRLLQWIEGASREQLLTANLIFDLAQGSYRCLPLHSFRASA